MRHSNLEEIYIISVTVLRDAKLSYLKESDLGVSILDPFTLLALPVFADGVTGRFPADEA